MKNENKEKPKFKIETIEEFLARGGAVKKINNFSNGYKKHKWPSLKNNQNKKNENKNAA